MFYIDIYKEKLRFYILLILSTSLMETFPCKVLMKLPIYRNSKLDSGRSYAFLYRYEQTFSGEQPGARGSSCFLYCDMINIR